jgi:hypothetical protein
MSIAWADEPGASGTGVEADSEGADADSFRDRIDRTRTADGEEGKGFANPSVDK